MVDSRVGRCSTRGRLPGSVTLQRRREERRTDGSGSLTGSHWSRSDRRPHLRKARSAPASLKVRTRLAGREPGDGMVQARDQQSEPSGRAAACGQRQPRRRRQRRYPPPTRRQVSARPSPGTCSSPVSRLAGPIRYRRRHGHPMVANPIARSWPPCESRARSRIRLRAEATPARLSEQARGRPVRSDGRAPCPSWRYRPGPAVPNPRFGGRHMAPQRARPCSGLRHRGSMTRPLGSAG